MPPWRCSAELGFCGIAPVRRGAMLVPLHVAGGGMCGRKRDGAPFVFHPKGRCGDGSHIPYFHPQISEEGTSSALVLREQDYPVHITQLGDCQLAVEINNAPSII